MIASLLSGLLSGLALPTSLGAHRLPDLGGLIWISLIPFYLSLRRSKPKEAFQKGFVFGAGYYGVSFYWITIALHTYGQVSIVSSLLTVAVMVMMFAIFVAATALLAVLFQGRKEGSLVLSLSLAWVVLDFVRNYFPFGGFPWSSLAYTQGSFLTLLQVLDVTGIAGITFLIVLSNGVLGEIWLWFRKRRSFPFVGTVSCACLLSVALVYGHFRLVQVRKDVANRETLRLSLIQGNIPQDEKWLEELVEEIIALHLAMSRQAERDIGPDLIIWPEAAYTAAVEPGVDTIDPVNELKTPLLMGAVTYVGEIPEAWPPPYNTQTFSLYNSAFLVRPGGEIAGWYSKMKLVPMGEYVPLGRLLSFLNQVVPSISSFTPGKELGLMELPKKEGTHRFGITICYEDLFPEISRALTRKGADFLVNLTNDAWYGHSSAVFQHFDFSRYRAIENRRSMARATNTGITGFFSPTGEVMAEAPIFQEAIVSMDIPMGGPVSFYTRYGDLFAWGCVLGLALLGERKLSRVRRPLKGPRTGGRPQGP